MPTLAQRLRKNPTPAEIRFWRIIDPLRRTGVQFCKQVAMRPYVDFACHGAKLVVEVDGDLHFTDAAMAGDAVRDVCVAARGYLVLRFTNDEVMGMPIGSITLSSGR